MKRKKSKKACKIR